MFYQRLQTTQFLSALGQGTGVLSVLGSLPIQSRRALVAKCCSKAPGVGEAWLTRFFLRGGGVQPWAKLHGGRLGPTLLFKGIPAAQGGWVRAVVRFVLQEQLAPNSS